MAWAQRATELSSSVLNSLFGDKKKHPRVGVLEDVWIGILGYWIGD